ncbi:MAG: solute carrier family 23 protein [Pseudomonadota bacterium]
MQHSLIQTGYGLDDKPGHGVAALTGLQHLLAVFGGIVTAPFLIAAGMGLDGAEIEYFIASALVVSGMATLIQIARFGGIGSGLLSIQGTSFTFVGPLIFVYSQRASDTPFDVVLGQIFTACLICALLMMVLARNLHRLQRIMTPSVAGTTVMLLGITLIWASYNTLKYEVATTGGIAWGLAAIALVTVLVFAFVGKPMLRLMSIALGLLVGLIAAVAVGATALPSYAELPTLFVPQPLRYAPALDVSIVVALLPIFIVSATESVGDLTATARLSGLPVEGRSFLSRLRGGISADALNSAIAAILATFPNTTFSQNNGVIRLTGVASRRVGLYVGGFLIIAGALPAVAATLRVMPGSVVAGATLLMFVMVAVSGWNIVSNADQPRRAQLIVWPAIAVGLCIPLVLQKLPGLPSGITTVLGFPVSTGAFAAMILELVIPRPTEPHSATQGLAQ